MKRRDLVTPHPEIRHALGLPEKVVVLEIRESDECQSGVLVTIAAPEIHEIDSLWIVESREKKMVETYEQMTAFETTQQELWN